MPCFLPGKATAAALGSALTLPVYEFSHQDGHIMAALASGGAPETMLEKPFIAFHVSGGTTEVVLATPLGSSFSCEVIGGTLDMNAGQAIDRVGVAMGLQFPCGPEMERLALACDSASRGIRVSVSDGKCNLSGLENKAVKLFLESGDREKTARFTLDFIAEN